MENERVELQAALRSLYYDYKLQFIFYTFGYTLNLPILDDVRIKLIRC